MVSRKKNSKSGKSNSPKKDNRTNAAGKARRYVGAMGVSGGIGNGSLGNTMKAPTSETRKAAVRTPSRNTAGADELMSTWTDFQKNLNSQFSGMMATQKRYYGDLVEKWNAITDDISGKITEAGGRDVELNEMMSKWEHYQASMKKRIEEFIAMENVTFEALNQKWKDHSENVGETIKTLASGKDPKDLQKKVLDSWTDMTSEMNQRFKSGIETGNDGIKDLRDTWMGLMKDIEEQTREMRDATPEMTEAVAQWREASWKMNTEIMEYVDNTVDEMSKLQHSWYNSMTDMSNQIMNGMWKGMEKSNNSFRRD